MPRPTFAGIGICFPSIIIVRFACQWIGADGIGTLAEASVDFCLFAVLKKKTSVITTAKPKTAAIVIVVDVIDFFTMSKTKERQVYICFSFKENEKK